MGGRNVKAPFRVVSDFLYYKFVTANKKTGVLILFIGDFLLVTIIILRVHCICKMVITNRKRVGVNLNMLGAVSVYIQSMPETFLKNYPCSASDLLIGSKN